MRRKLFILVLLPLVASLPACTLAANGIESTPAMDITQVYETVRPVLTLTNASIPTSHATVPAMDQPVDSSNTPRPTPVFFTQEVVTVEATPTPTREENCNRAAPGFPGIDVTIDDDMVMEPGARFTKIWRLTNVGTCPWKRDYQAVWFFGTKFGDTTSVNLGQTVEPGASIDIIVDMVAPQTAGAHRSNWKLQDGNGDMFGIGPNGSSPFWVQIVVVLPPTATPSATVTPTFTPTLTPSPTATPTPTATAVVYARQDVILNLDDQLDLDEIEVNPAAGSDLFYESDENLNYWLVPENQLMLGVHGMEEPGLRLCQAATMSSAPVAVGSLSPGMYLCFVTSEGRIGWMRLTSVDTSVFSIHLEIQNWEPNKEEADS